MIIHLRTLKNHQFWEPTIQESLLRLSQHTQARNQAPRQLLHISSLCPLPYGLTNLTRWKAQSPACPVPRIQTGNARVTFSWFHRATIFLRLLLLLLRSSLKPQTCFQDHLSTKYPWLNQDQCLAKLLLPFDPKLTLPSLGLSSLTHPLPPLLLPCRTNPHQIRCQSIGFSISTPHLRLPSHPSRSLHHCTSDLDSSHSPCPFSTSLHLPLLPLRPRANSLGMPSKRPSCIACSSSSLASVRRGTWREA